MGCNFLFNLIHALFLSVCWHIYNIRNTYILFWNVRGLTQNTIMFLCNHGLYRCGCACAEANAFRAGFSKPIERPHQYFSSNNSIHILLDNGTLSIMPCTYNFYGNIGDFFYGRFMLPLILKLDVITHPYPNFNGASWGAVEVWAWMSNYILLFLWLLLLNWAILGYSNVNVLKRQDGLVAVQLVPLNGLQCWHRRLCSNSVRRTPNLLWKR